MSPALALLPVVVTGAAMFALWRALSTGLAIHAIEHYREAWSRSVLDAGAPRWLRHTPEVQAAIAGLSLLVAGIAADSAALLPIPLALGLPTLVLRRCAATRRSLMRLQLDSFLVSLADALSTVPNLLEALSTVGPEVEAPLGEEIGHALALVQLGRGIDEALGELTRRVDDPGLEAAVGALLLGHRSGGDIGTMLRRIAETVREMARLEGVLRTKTAEGRSQAWVMGAVPPGLLLLLNVANPEWLAPLWNDPLGWVILAAAAGLEAMAIVLIRRILAVDL